MGNNNNNKESIFFKIQIKNILAIANLIELRNNM